MRAAANRALIRLLAELPVAVALSASLSNAAHAAGVVTIGGTVTEIVYLLGEQQQIVATDTSSIYPADTEQLPKVGYQRTLSTEGVLSKHPDKILLTPAAGPAKVLQQLQDSGITVVTIDGPDTQGGIAAKVQQVADQLGVPEKGQAAVARLNQDFAALSVPSGWHRPPRLLFVLQMGGSPMIAGQGTAPDALFRMAGAVNAVAMDDEQPVTGYKNLTPEALLLARPDAIVVTDQGLSRQGGDSAIWKLPGMAATPAAKAGRLLHLDVLLALGLGPRTPQAITELQQQLAGWQP